MGLDQYAGVMEEKKSEHFKNEDGSYDTWQQAGPFEWRKHARLQEFMTRLFMVKNSKSAKDRWQTSTFGNEEVIIPIQFNEMELDDVDIKLLEEAIENGYKDFHCEGGFFWGHQFQEEAVKDYAEKDREFVKFAKEELAKGNKIFYECSW